METGIVIAALAFSLLCLWLIARHDWIRLTRPRRTVLAQVTGHRASFSDGDRTYAAIYAFSDEHGPHEVIDAVYTTVARPAVGTMRELGYPEGRPDLARPSRPLVSIALYSLFGLMIAVLLANLLGWID